MNTKDKYIIERMKKKIRLVNIAKEIGCSPSLLSKYENNECEMSEEKVLGYRQYIDKS